MKKDKLIQLVAVGLVTEAVMLDQSFTAYDITKATREVVGKDIEVLHDTIRDVVKAVYNEGAMTNYSAKPDVSIHEEPLRYASPTSQVKVKPKVVQVSNPIMTAYNAGVQTGIPLKMQLEMDGFNTTTGKPETVSMAGKLSYSQSIGEVRLLKSLLKESNIDAGTTVQVFKPQGLDQIFISESEIKTNMPGVTKQYKVDSKHNLRLSLNSLGSKKYSRLVAKANGKGNILISCN